tara:strand:+ start:507 stop:1226 length:720 start_codon:yes stop_codon:yes gene_type:complete
MADENKTEQPQEEVVEKKEETKEVKEETQRKYAFTQEDLDRILNNKIGQVTHSLEKKYGMKPEEAIKLKQEQDKLKIEEQKKKGEFEQILKDQAEKSNIEIQKLKSEIEKIKVDGSLLEASSKHKAINPKQVADLLKPNIKLNDDGRVEVLDENKNTRYNGKGEPVSIDEAVSEFLTQNPHFQSATPSGSGSVANVGKVDPKPFDIGALDMAKPEDRAKFAAYRKDRRSKPTVIDLTKS